jgi:hypothetical protein
MAQGGMTSPTATDGFLLPHYGQLYRWHGLKCASEPHDEISLLDSLARQLL